MALICSFGWFYIIKGYRLLRREGFATQLPKWYLNLIYLYLFICVIMIARGYMIDYPYQWISTQGCINFHLFTTWYIWCYFMPLVVFIPWTKYNLGLYVKFCAIIAVCSMFIIAISFQEIKQLSVRAAFGLDTDVFESAKYAFFYTLGFIVLIKKYIKQRTWLLCFIALALCLLIAIMTGRRGRSAIIASILLMNFYFYIKSVNQRYRPLLLLGCIIMVIGVVEYFSNSSLVSFISNRGLDDSRSGVDIALMTQMTPIEHLFGQGLNGRYYYLVSENPWRYSSETGFYNLVLKGGYLMAVLYIIILIIPAFKGLFKSNNLFCRALGFYILLSVLELYPFGWLEFDLKFLIIWIGVALCMNTRVRQMDDNEIYERFF